LKKVVVAYYCLGILLEELIKIAEAFSQVDRFCGLVVRVPGYTYRVPGLDSQRYQIFGEVVGLERGQLSLVRIIEELLEWKVAASV
jgi:hypothetical protein